MALLVLYYVATRGVFQGKYSGDGLFGFEYLRALVYEQTLDMQKVLPEWLPYFSVHPVTKHMPNRCPLGPVFVWLPFYLIACGITHLGQLLGIVGPVKANTVFHAWMAGLGTLAATLIGYRHVFLMIERHLGRAAARLGATAAIWATPIAWYAVTQPMYQHGAAFGFVALLLDRWDATRGETQPRRFLWLGLIGGLGMSMRAQEVLYLFLPAAEVAWGVLGGPDRKRWLVGGVVLVAAALAAFAPQLYAWWFYTGGLYPPQVEPLRWADPMFVVVLFSTRGGLFPWSPIAYAAAIGLVLARKARHLAIGLGVLFAIELYICAAAWMPSGGYGYGARRLSDVAPLLGLGVALLYHRAAQVRWQRRLVVGFTALCVVLCLFTMEMQRAGKTKSSGGYARTGGTYLNEFGAPVWAQRALDAIGYPFVQPAGWIFALYHHVPVNAFEGVVGNLMLDRDGQWFTVLTKTLELDFDHRAHVASGLQLQRGVKESTVTGPVRLLIHMFAREGISVQLIGTIPEGPVAARWQGNELKLARTPTGLSFGVAERHVHTGVNELVLELPVGSKLKKLDFVGQGRPWVR
jgi:hypothetical protein